MCNLDHNVACDGEFIQESMKCGLNFANFISIYSFIGSLILIIKFITNPIAVIIIIINFFVFKPNLNVLWIKLHHWCLIFNWDFMFILQSINLVKERIINFVLQVVGLMILTMIINLIQSKRQKIMIIRITIILLNFGLMELVLSLFNLKRWMGYMGIIKLVQIGIDVVKLIFILLIPVFPIPKWNFMIYC